jgi:glycine/D-amino acid oxidase-like deaminating enzyme
LKAFARKARLYAPVEAVSFAETRDGVTIATREGPVISAGFAILATGDELMDTVPTAGHSIVSTYAIATAPQARFAWKDLPLVWEASEPYLNLRASADGRIICGGEDEDFSDTDKRYALIAQKTAAIAARVDASAQIAWAGSFGSSGPACRISAG